MKNLIVISIIATYLFSCTAGKLATISSPNVPQKNSSFIYENDTVRITYNFWAENGIMDFDIYNKINEPIFFDWKNSAFIPNDQMVSYWQDVTNTVGSSTTASSWLYSGVVSSRGASKSVRQERIAVIPPHALIKKKDFRLVSVDVTVPSVGTFSEENSFLNFRNYLMYSTNEKFEGKIMTLDNKFYVSDLKNIKFKKNDTYKKANSFFLKAISPKYQPKKKKS